MEEFAKLIKNLSRSVEGVKFVVIYRLIMITYPFQASRKEEGRLIA